jgi:hypothetical protein
LPSAIADTDNSRLPLKWKHSATTKLKLSEDFLKLSEIEASRRYVADKYRTHPQIFVRHSNPLKPRIGVRAAAGAAGPYPPISLASTYRIFAGFGKGVTSESGNLLEISCKPIWAASGSGNIL